MTEKVKINGLVKAVSNPFSNHPIESNMIIIQTDRGMMSVPVEDPHAYSLHENVHVSIVIERLDKEKRNV